MLEWLPLDAQIPISPSLPPGVRGDGMKTYIFRIELEADEEGWRAFYPPLENVGASTWGNTPDDALKNIQEVLSMILEERADANEPVPVDDGVSVSEGALVAVTL